MLFHVYTDPKPEGYFVNEPGGIYRTVLDADWPLWILLPALLLALVLGLMLAWRLHEIPKHKADGKKMRQVELVSALTLFGLFEHWVWAIALFIAYVDWEAVEDAAVRVLRMARLPATDGTMAEGITADRIEINDAATPESVPEPTEKPVAIGNEAEDLQAKPIEARPTEAKPIEATVSNEEGRQ